MTSWNILPYQLNTCSADDLKFTVTRSGTDSFYQLNIDYNPEHKTLQLHFTPQNQNLVQGKERGDESKTSSKICSTPKNEQKGKFNKLKEISNKNMDRVHKTDKNIDLNDYYELPLTENVKKLFKRDVKKYKNLPASQEKLNMKKSRVRLIHNKPTKNRRIQTSITESELEPNELKEKDLQVESDMQTMCTKQVLDKNKKIYYLSSGSQGPFSMATATLDTKNKYVINANHASIKKHSHRKIKNHHHYINKDEISKNDVLDFDMKQQPTRELLENDTQAPCLTNKGEKMPFRIKKHRRKHIASIEKSSSELNPQRRKIHKARHANKRSTTILNTKDENFIKVIEHKHEDYQDKYPTLLHAITNNSFPEPGNSNDPKKKYKKTDLYTSSFTNLNPNEEIKIRNDALKVVSSKIKHKEHKHKKGELYLNEKIKNEDLLFSKILPRLKKHEDNKLNEEIESKMGHKAPSVNKNRSPTDEETNQSVVKCVENSDQKTIKDHDNVKHLKHKGGHTNIMVVKIRDGIGKFLDTVHPKSNIIFSSPNVEDSLRHKPNASDDCSETGEKGLKRKKNDHKKSNADKSSVDLLKKEGTYTVLSMEKKDSCHSKKKRDKKKCRNSLENIMEQESSKDVNISGTYSTSTKPKKRIKDIDQIPKFIRLDSQSQTAEGTQATLVKEVINEEAEEERMEVTDKSNVKNSQELIGIDLIRKESSIKEYTRKEISFSQLNLQPLPDLYALTPSDTVDASNISIIPIKSKKSTKTRRKDKSFDQRSIMSDNTTRRERHRYVCHKKSNNSNTVESRSKTSKLLRKSKITIPIYVVDGLEPPKPPKLRNMKKTSQSNMAKMLHAVLLPVMEIKPISHNVVEENQSNKDGIIKIKQPLNNVLTAMGLLPNKITYKQTLSKLGEPFSRTTDESNLKNYRNSKTQTRMKENHRVRKSSKSSITSSESTVQLTQLLANISKKQDECNTSNKNFKSIKRQPKASEGRRNIEAVPNTLDKLEKTTLVLLEIKPEQQHSSGSIKNTKSNTSTQRVSHLPTPAKDESHKSITSSNTSISTINSVGNAQFKKQPPKLLTKHLDKKNEQLEKKTIPNKVRMEKKVIKTFDNPSMAKQKPSEVSLSSRLSLVSNESRLSQDLLKTLFRNVDSQISKTLQRGVSNESNKQWISENLANNAIDLNEGKSKHSSASLSSEISMSSKESERYTFSFKGTKGLKNSLDYDNEFNDNQGSIVDKKSESIDLQGDAKSGVLTKITEETLSQDTLSYYDSNNCLKPNTESNDNVKKLSADSHEAHKAKPSCAKAQQETIKTITNNPAFEYDKLNKNKIENKKNSSVLTAVHKIRNEPMIKCFIEPHNLSEQVSNSKANDRPKHEEQDFSIIAESVRKNVMSELLSQHMIKQNKLNELVRNCAEEINVQALDELIAKNIASVLKEKRVTSSQSTSRASSLDRSKESSESNKLKKNRKTNDLSEGEVLQKSKKQANVFKSNKPSVKSISNPSTKLKKEVKSPEVPEEHKTEEIIMKELVSMISNKFPEFCLSKLLESDKPKLANIAQNLLQNQGGAEVVLKKQIKSPKQAQKFIYQNQIQTISMCSISNTPKLAKTGAKSRDKSPNDVKQRPFTHPLFNLKRPILSKRSTSSQSRIPKSLNKNLTKSVSESLRNLSGNSEAGLLEKYENKSESLERRSQNLSKIKINLPVKKGKEEAKPLSTFEKRKLYGENIRRKSVRIKTDNSMQSNEKKFNRDNLCCPEKGNTLEKSFLSKTSATINSEEQFNKISTPSLSDINLSNSVEKYEQTATSGDYQVSFTNSNNLNNLCFELCHLPNKKPNTSTFTVACSNSENQSKNNLKPDISKPAQSKKDERENSNLQEQEKKTPEDNVYQTFVVIADHPNVKDVFKNKFKTPESSISLFSRESLFSYDNYNCNSHNSTVSDFACNKSVFKRKSCNLLSVQDSYNVFASHNLTSAINDRRKTKALYLNLHRKKFSTLSLRDLSDIKDTTQIFKEKYSNSTPGSLDIWAEKKTSGTIIPPAIDKCEYFENSYLKDYMESITKCSKELQAKSNSDNRRSQINLSKDFSIYKVSRIRSNTQSNSENNADYSDPPPPPPKQNTFKKHVTQLNNQTHSPFNKVRSIKLEELRQNLLKIKEKNRKTKPFKSKNQIKPEKTHKHLESGSLKRSTNCKHCHKAKNNDSSYLIFKCDKNVQIQKERERVLNKEHSQENFKIFTYNNVNVNVDSPLWFSNYINNMSLKKNEKNRNIQSKLFSCDQYISKIQNFNRIWNNQPISISSSSEIAESGYNSCNNQEVAFNKFVDPCSTFTLENFNPDLNPCTTLITFPLNLKHTINSTNLSVSGCSSSMAIDSKERAQNEQEENVLPNNIDSDSNCSFQGIYQFSYQNSKADGCLCHNCNKECDHCKNQSCKSHVPISQSSSKSWIRRVLSNHTNKEVSIKTDLTDQSGSLNTNWRKKRENTMTDINDSIWQSDCKESQSATKGKLKTFIRSKSKDISVQERPKDNKPFWYKHYEPKSSARRLKKIISKKFKITSESQATLDDSCYKLSQTEENFLGEQSNSQLMEERSSCNFLLNNDPHFTINLDSIKSTRADLRDMSAKKSSKSKYINDSQVPEKLINTIPVPSTSGAILEGPDSNNLIRSNSNMFLPQNNNMETNIMDNVINLKEVFNRLNKTNTALEIIKKDKEDKPSDFFKYYQDLIKGTFGNKTFKLLKEPKNPNRRKRDINPPLNKSSQKSASINTPLPKQTKNKKLQVSEDFPTSAQSLQSLFKNPNEIKRILKKLLEMIENSSKEMLEEQSKEALKILLDQSAQTNKEVMNLKDSFNLQKQLKNNEILNMYRNKFAELSLNQNLNDTCNSLANMFAQLLKELLENILNNLCSDMNILQSKSNQNESEHLKVKFKSSKDLKRACSDIILNEPSPFYSTCNNILNSVTKSRSETNVSKSLINIKEQSSEKIKVMLNKSIQFKEQNKTNSSIISSTQTSELHLNNLQSQTKTNLNLSSQYTKKIASNNSEERSNSKSLKTLLAKDLQEEVYQKELPLALEKNQSSPWILIGQTNIKDNRLVNKIQSLKPPMKSSCDLNTKPLIYTTNETQNTTKTQTKEDYCANKQSTPCNKNTCSALKCDNKKKIDVIKTGNIIQKNKPTHTLDNIPKVSKNTHQSEAIQKNNSIPDSVLKRMSKLPLQTILKLYNTIPDSHNQEISFEKLIEELCKNEALIKQLSISSQSQEDIIHILKDCINKSLHPTESEAQNVPKEDKKAAQKEKDLIEKILVKDVIETEHKKSDKKEMELNKLRNKLTEKELFEKLLNTYENEEKMVDRLSNDEEFFQSQLELVRNKVSIESILSGVKETKNDYQEAKNWVSHSSDERILQTLNMDPLRNTIENPKEHTSSSRSLARTSSKSIGNSFKTKVSRLFRGKSNGSEMNEIVAPRTEMYRQDSVEHTYFGKDRDRVEEFEDNQKVTFTNNQRFESLKKTSLENTKTARKNKNTDCKKQRSNGSYESNVIAPTEIGKCFMRGFRSDYVSLSGDTCLYINKDNNADISHKSNEAEQVINFSERESPLEYLLALGFSIDEASNAIKDEDVKNRLFAAITEARIWVNQISTIQGTLLYLIAYKARPKTMRYFLQLVEAIINNRIDNAVRLDGFLKVIEKVEDGDVTMIHILGSEKFMDEDEENFVKKQLRQIFIQVYKTAENEAGLKNKKITNNAISLLRILAAKYRAGLQPHLQLIARYIGQNLLHSEVQLEAAMIYLSRLDTPQVNLQEFERYCGINQSHI